MKRVSLALLVALVACGGKQQNSPPLAPLPADKPAEPVAAKPEPAKPEPEPTPEPLPPLDIKLPANAFAVKVTSAGKGKKSKLAYKFTPGSKQQVRIALDVQSAQTIAGNTENINIPTLVLLADAEVKEVAADGTATYAIVVTGADALPVANSTVKVDEFKRDLISSVPGMTLAGTVAPNGTAGDIAIHIEKPDPASLGPIQMVRLSLPTWIQLPAEAVGAGAKWRATSNQMLQEKVAVTITTDYELVSRTATTWVVKGTTKVSGAEQNLDGATVKDIGGTGTTNATVNDGTLYPTIDTGVETVFTATQGTESLKISFLTKGTIGPP